MIIAWSWIHTVAMFNIPTIVVCVSKLNSNSTWNIVSRFVWLSLSQQNILRCFVTILRMTFELTTVMAASKLNENLFLFTYRIIRIFCSTDICQQKINSIFVRLIPFPFHGLCEKITHCNLCLGSFGYC